MRALIVDDSRAIRLILGRMVRDLGIEVTEAANGEEALAAIDDGLNVEVMLVDWNMPIMSGIDFIQAVRAPPRGSEAKILMVTTETEVGHVMRALSAGADEYVMKPFTREAILEKLQMLGLEP
jgi:two-component system chemotaxis response regulator CheY